jgi:HlyD family secretion protein
LAVLVGCSRARTGIVGSGTVELDEVDVSSLVGGRVERLFVDEGDSVALGDTLAILERGEIAGEVESRAAETERAQALYKDMERGPRAAERRTARAERDAAVSAEVLADSELVRTRGLFDRQLASRAELDRSRAARDGASATRAAAEERLALLEEGYRRGQVAAAREAAQSAQGAYRSSRARANELVLVAPIRGVVLLKNAELGEVVGAGIPALTLGDPDRLWVRCYLATPEVARVKVGSTAHVRVLGWADRDFPGRVVEIATRAEFTPRAALTEEERASIVFRVKVALEPSGGRLKPGLPADVTIDPIAP